MWEAILNPPLASTALSELMSWKDVYVHRPQQRPSNTQKNYCSNYLRGWAVQHSCSSNFVLVVQCFYKGSCYPGSGRWFCRDPNGLPFWESKAYKVLPCQSPCHPSKRTDLSALSHVWSYCWESHLLLQLTAPETRPIQQLHKSSGQASSRASSSWQHMVVLLPPPVNASIMLKVNTSSPTVNSIVTRHSAAQWFSL